jgi:mono/diheme cytochrome c family protein
MPLKSVGSLGDIYRVIAAGVGGTAMPTWDGALEPEKLWAMAIYVQSLVEEGRRIVDAASGIAPSPAGAAK